MPARTRLVSAIFQKNSSVRPARDASAAKKLIESMGGRELKAVIIDSSMVDADANGGSLPSWMDKEFPNVPVWVNNCEPAKGRAVKKVPWHWK